MADSGLSTAQIEAAADFVNRNAIDPSDPCPHCGKVPSSVLPYVSWVDFGAHPLIPTRNYPAITTVCNVCGFIRQFAAAVVGVGQLPTPAAPVTEGDVNG